MEPRDVSEEEGEFDLSADLVGRHQDFALVTERRVHSGGLGEWHPEHREERAADPLKRGTTDFAARIGRQALHEANAPVRVQPLVVAREVGNPSLAREFASLLARASGFRHLSPQVPPPTGDVPPPLSSKAVCRASLAPHCRYCTRMRW